MHSRKIFKGITILVLISIFIIPVDTRLITGDLMGKYQIFNVLRNIFILSGILILIFAANSKKIYILSIGTFILILLKYCIYSEIDFGYMYLLASLILLSNLDRGIISGNSFEKLFSKVYYLFIAQIIFCTIYNLVMTKQFKVTSFFNDANYTAYFIFILGMYMYFKNYKIKSYSLFLGGIFTYSRLFFLCIIVFALMKNLFWGKRQLKLERYLYNFKFYILVQFIIILVSFLYVQMYAIIKPEYVYVQGFGRIFNMFDESNYIRTLANVLALESIDFISFFIGVKSECFIGLHIFENKSIFPHNLVYGLIVQYGVIATVVFIKKYVYIFRRYGQGLSPYFICLILYHSFLGLSSFYGIDLVIQIIILKIIYRSRGEEGI